MNMLSKTDLNQLESRMMNVVEKHSLSDEHIGLRLLLSREKRRQEIWDKVKASVIGALIVGGLI